MPTPTPEMDAWIYSIYGKNPAWFARGGGYGPPSDASSAGAPPVDDGAALGEMDLAFGGGPVSTAGDPATRDRPGAIGAAVDWTKDKFAAGAHAVGQFDAAHSHALTRAAGAAQTVGGAAEALTGAVVAGGGGLATGTGMGAAPGIPAMIGGAALAVNGADNAAAGLSTLLTGEPHHTVVSQAAGAGAKMLGASDATAARVTDGVDLAQGLAGGGAAAAAGMTRKGAGEAAALGRTEKVAGDAGKAGEAPRPPVALSGKALELSNALREAPKGSPKRAKLVEEFAEISTHVKPPPNRVVLGKWEQPGKGGYIDNAQAKGGIWYETPPDSYQIIGPEAAWETNVAFLRQQLASGVPKLEFTNMKVAEALAGQAKAEAEAASLGDVAPTPARIKEIRFLIENADTYGYKLVGNEFIKVR